jgi:hypothetical protein
VTGEWPNKEVDHVNCARSDNRFANLRLATRAENGRNTLRPCSNTSGYKGVWWHKKDKVWRSAIKINRKSINLGSFKTPEDAYAAYCAANEKYHGVFGRVA